MTPAKKTSHYCSRHRGIKSVGKCKICGTLVCSSCCIIFKNQIYCTATCIPHDLINVKEISTNAKNGPVKSHSIRLWAIITLILCCIAGGSFATKEIVQLRQENSELQDSRMHLIKTLKSSNQEIYYLKSSMRENSDTAEIAALKAPFDIKKPVFKITVQKNDSYQSAPTPFTFNNGSTEKNLISLTFDGGSDANVALPILDTLRSRNVKVTVFLTGQFIKNFPDIVQLYLSEGHEIGNHTFSHLHLTSYAQDKTQTTLPEITKEQLLDDLRKNQALFYSLTGQQMAPFWRGPYGEFNRTLCSWASEGGYLHIGWRQGPTWRQGLDSNDWIPNEETPGFKTPAEVLDKILGIANSKSDALNGGIILMHLGTKRKDPNQQVYTILGTLIDSLQQRGFRIVPVSEMVKESGFYLASLPSKTHFQETFQQITEEN